MLVFFFFLVDAYNSSNKLSIRIEAPNITYTINVSISVLFFMFLFFVCRALLEVLIFGEVVKGKINKHKKLNLFKVVMTTM